MAESVLDHAAAFGAEWFFAFLVAIGFGILAKQLLNEYQRNNERKAELEERNAARQAELELKREERKRDELNERAQRDRERSEMEGRIAAQMERSNNISEGLQAAMDSLRLPRRRCTTKSGNRASTRTIWQTRSITSTTA